MKKNMLKGLCAAVLVSIMFCNIASEAATKQEIKQKQKEIKALQVKAPDYTEDYIGLNSDLFFMLDGDKNYKCSQKVLNKILTASETMYGSGSVDTAYWYVRAAELYGNLNQPAEAQQYFDKAFLIVQNNPKDTNLKEFYNERLFNYYMTFNRYNEASALLSKFPNKTKEQKENIKNKRSDLDFALGNISNCIKGVENEIKSLEKKGTVNKDLYDLYLSDAKLNLLDYRYKAFTPLYTKADAIGKKLELPVNDEFNMLWALNDYYIRTNDYKNYKKTIDRRYDIAKELKSKELKKEVYSDYIGYYQTAGNKKLEKRYIRKESRVIGRNNRSNKLNKFENYDYLLAYYQENGMTNKAKKLYADIFTYIDPIKDLIPRKTAIYNQGYASFLKNEENYDEAAVYFAEAEKYWKKCYPEYSGEVANLYNDMVNFYKAKNDIANASKYEKKMNSIVKRIYNPNSLDMYYRYLDSANNNANQGKKQEACANMDKAVNIIKNIYGTDNVAYYRANLNKIGLYEQLGKKDKADEIYFNLLNNGKKINGDLTEYYYELNLYRSTVAKELGRYEEALSYAFIAEKYAVNQDRKNGLYSYISDVYGLMGNDKKAKAYKKKVK